MKRSGTTKLARAERASKVERATRPAASRRTSKPASSSEPASSRADAIAPEASAATISRRRVPTIITTTADISRGVRALRRGCAVMDRVAASTGTPPLRRYAPDLEGLARIVVGQQLSVASAEAIWRRTHAALAPLTGARLVAASDTEMRAAGLSAPKMRTLRALGTAICRDGLDLQRLADASDDRVREQLTAVSGIGPWTADIFILFCLGRSDGWAAGDLALQLALQRVFDLPARPLPVETVAMAERWRPWRGVAARLLWAYYGLPRRGAGDAPL